MNKKRLFLLIMVVVLSMFFVFSAGTTDKSTSKPITLNLGHLQTTTHPLHESALQFAQYVKEKTNGEVLVKIFPASQLGDTRELVEAVKLGTVDIVQLGASSFGVYVPSFYSFDLGYLFKDFDQLFKMMDGPFGESLKKESVEKEGVRQLSFFSNGVRHLTTSKHAVHNPQDLVGLKIRAPEIETYMACINAMGASATPIAFNELFLALQTKIVDGQENPITTINAMKYYEVQDYLIMTGHILTSMSYAINESKFQSLTPEQQIIIAEASKLAGDYNTVTIKQNDEKLLPVLQEKGMTVIEVDRSEFRNKVLPVSLDLAKKYLSKDQFEILMQELNN